MDVTNPAVDRHVTLPPKALDDVAESADALAKISRVQALLVQDRMVRLALESESIPQLATTHEQLRKAASLAENASLGPSSGFTININVPAVNGRAPVTIEAKAPAVLPEPATADGEDV